jgi:hypothetical protein
LNIEVQRRHSHADLKPLKSSGYLIGLVDDVVSRNPLSQILSIHQIGLGDLRGYGRRRSPSMAFQTVSCRGMREADAADRGRRTSSLRIRPDSVKNRCLPPERIWSAYRCRSRAGYCENLQVEAAVGLVLIAAAISLARDVHRVRIGKIAGRIVGEFRPARARPDGALMRSKPPRQPMP